LLAFRIEFPVIPRRQSVNSRFALGFLLRKCFLTPLSGFLTIVFLATCGHLAFGQQTLGSINGNVTDSSGAVIQGAQVKARAVATNLEVAATTKADGSFNIADLPNPAAFGITPPIAPGTGGVPLCDPNSGVCDNYETPYATGGRNIFRGPFQNRFDFGLSKDFKFKEAWALRYDVIAFNIFNHPSFDIPATMSSSIPTMKTRRSVGRIMALRNSHRASKALARTFVHPQAAWAFCSTPSAARALSRWRCT
jgi:hypothetical protein